MMDLEALLRPISEASPSGRFLRREAVYDDIQEAGRQDDDVPAGDWERKLKKADWPAVTRLATDALTKHTKDLQIAAWLVEAQAYQRGWSGLSQGFILLRELQERFWDTVFPLLDEEDGPLFRVRPLGWLASRLEDAVRRIPITRDGFTWLDFHQSRKVGYEAAADTSEKLEIREAAIAEGKLSAEEFDKSFYRDKWGYYKPQLEAIAAALEAVDALEADCDQRYADASPSFRAGRDTMVAVQDIINSLCQPIRQAEVPVAPVVPAAEVEAGPVAENVHEAAPVAVAPRLAPVRAGGDPVADTARFLRKQSPASHTPFLLLRGVRWGELRDALRSGAELPAPATAVRQRLRALSSASSWEELLEATEEALSSPDGSACLDLQRYAITACEQLGGERLDVAVALRASLGSLLDEFPELPRKELADGTQAANPETARWLGLLQRQRARALAPAVADAPEGGDPDVYEIAGDALAAGRREEAVQILWKATQEAASGRARFLRRLQLADICLRAGAPMVALPLLEDLVAEAESRKLVEWEDTSIHTRPLRLLYDCLTALDTDETRRGDLKTLLRRLDPAGALAISD